MRIYEWEQRKLGDIADIKDSARISNELWVENGIPYLRSSDLVNGELNGELFISKETYEGYASKTGAPQKDDVLFTSGGKVGVVYHKKDESPVYVQGGAVLYVKTSTSNLLDGSFLSIYFSSPRMQTYMDIASSGGTIKHFTLKPANASPIIFPSLSEQQQIGTFFKKLDDTIALHQRKLTLLAQLKKAYQQVMFPQGEESIPALRVADFLEPWEQRKLGEHSQILTGGTPKTQIQEFWEPKEIPWMSSGEINKKRLFSTDNQISKLGFESCSARWVKKNSVLIALAGQGKTRGTVAINEIPLTTNQSIAAIEPNDKLDSEFLFQNLENRYEELRLASSGDGSRGGLNKQIISDIKILIPSIKEQRKVGVFFKQLDDTIDLHQIKLQKFSELKKVLLSKMFV